MYEYCYCNDIYIGGNCWVPFIIYLVYYLISVSFAAIANLTWCQKCGDDFVIPDCPTWTLQFQSYRQMASLDQMVWAILTGIRVSREEWGKPSQYTNLYDGRCGWWYLSSLYAPRWRQEELQASKGNIRETVDLFIAALCNLAERCKYSALHDNMIQDRIIVGIKGSLLSERMQLNDALTLEKATKMVRQSKTVKLKMKRLPNDRSLEAIKTGRKVYRTRPQILAYRTTKKTPNYRSKENADVQTNGTLSEQHN